MKKKKWKEEEEFKKLLETKTSWVIIEAKKEDKLALDG